MAFEYNDSAGTIDANPNDFTITLTGDVNGNGTITDLADVSIPTTIDDDFDLTSLAKWPSSIDAGQVLRGSSDGNFYEWDTYIDQANEVSVEAARYSGNPKSKRHYSTGGAGYFERTKHLGNSICQSSF